MDIKNFIFYAIFSGIVYASFMYDSKSSPTKTDNILNCIFGILNGFYFFPILIGRALRKIID